MRKSKYQILPRFRGGRDEYQDTMDFLKYHEGFNDVVYKDGNGIPTIGYGFTDPSLVKKGRISKKAAQARLRQEVITRDAFLKNLKNWDKLGDGAKTALRSYYYNYPAGFRDTTKFMKAWNAGDYAEAIRQVDAGMNDATNPGLRKRRLAEQGLLNQDPYIQSIINQKPRYTTTVAEENAKMQFQPWSNYHGTDYPINNLAPASISSWNSPQSPAYTPVEYDASQSYLRLPNIKSVIEQSIMSPKFKNGKLPGYRIGHNVSHAKLNDDGTFTDDYTRTFEDMVVTPRRTELKRGSYSANNWNYAKAHRKDWMKTQWPSAVVDDKPLEEVYPEFDLLLAGQALKPLVKKGYQKAADKVLNSKFVQNRTFVNNESALGDLLGDGSEQTVFVNRRNPSEVLKVYDGTNQKTVNDAKEFANKIIELRNSAPQVPIRRYGYILQDGKIKPVFAQKRLNNLVDPEIRWNDPEWINYQKQLDDLFNSNGWTGKGTYTKGNLTASDVQPGNIGFYDDGTIAPFDIDVYAYANGKSPIHIKPSKRGSFTAAAKRRGMSVSQLESAVLNNPSKYSKAMRKKAQFSRNARSWKK